MLLMLKIPQHLKVTNSWHWKSKLEQASQTSSQTLRTVLMLTQWDHRGCYGCRATKFSPRKGTELRVLSCGRNLEALMV